MRSQVSQDISWIKELWTINHLFVSEDQTGSPPIRLGAKITVPSHRSTFETAGMVELAARIGLQVTNLKTPIFDNLFLFDKLDDELLSGRLPQKSDGSLQLSTSLVFGHDLQWIYEILGKTASKEAVTQSLFELEKALNSQVIGTKRELGIIYRTKLPIYDGGNLLNIVIVTGTSPASALRAVRFLATNGVANCISKTDDNLVLIHKENELEEGHVSRCEPGSVSPIWSLHNVFTDEGLFKCADDELFPALDVDFIVRRQSNTEAISFVELAARLAMSTAKVCFPVTTCMEESSSLSRLSITREITDYQANDIQSNSYVELVTTDSQPKLVLHSSENEAVRLVRTIIEEWFMPLHQTGLSWRNWFASLQSESPDIRSKAQLGLRAFREIRLGNIRSVQVPRHIARPVKQIRDYLNIDSLDNPPSIDVIEPTPILQAFWQDDGELVDIERYIDGQLTELFDKNAESRKVTDGSKLITIEVVTTVSQKTFTEWSDRLLITIAKKWNVSGRFIYRNANKAGLHWARSTVVPDLKGLTNVSYIQIQARSFSPKEKHLDLISRFLQEMYPLDAILSSELGLPLENIELELLEEPSPMFQIVALDEQRNELGKWIWEGFAKSFLYMEDNPELGYVCIPCAGCRLTISGDKQVREQTFRSNPHRFWGWYQKQLPEIVKQVGTVDGVPKFLSLECHVNMDAVDESIPYHEELISVLEALHEDIYFYSLHYFHEHGKQAGDSGWDAPGAVLPFMHSTPGEPLSAEISLFSFLTNTDLVLVDKEQNRVFCTLDDDFSVNVIHAGITSVHFKGSTLSFEFSGIQDKETEEVCSDWLGRTAQIRNLPMSRKQSTLSDTSVEPQSEAFIKNIQDDVLVNSDVSAWLKQHTVSLPGAISAYDFSFNGEPIWVVELFDIQNHEEISERAKHGLYKPTFFITARHHANEVTSTNSALEHVDQLSENPEILRRINVVVVPLENVDGANLHAKMTQEHPTWKHHSARYNACGMEFTNFRFKASAPFGESRITPKVWKSWRPDIVLDDHGVPSHEWIQPFSGYNSPPRFPVSYWVPQAGMYTIYRRMTNLTPEGLDVFNAIRMMVTDYLDEDAEIRRDNNEWLNVYQKWGNQFEPEVFPVELSNGNLAFIWDSEASRDSRNLIERYPEWVTADIITEVNDETVYQEELHKCAHAHHVVHQALIDFMLQTEIEILVKEEVRKNGKITVEIERKRPLIMAKESVL